MPGIDQLDVELLLAHVRHSRREHLLAHPDQALSLTAVHRFRSLIKKRAEGLPLAYLVGSKEFFGLNFIVNKFVLVPRPETELIVEMALDRLQESDFSNQTSDFRKPKSESRSPKAILVDLGTGSGCIPIAIMKTLETKKQKNTENKKTLVRVIGTDISQWALRVARKNARRHGVDITFLHGNLLEPIIKTYNPTSPAGGLKPITYNLIITANLPYLTEEQYASEPSIQSEPKSALVAKNNGLALYEKLLKQIQTLISSFPHFFISCFFEIDPSQSRRITSLIQDYLPGAKVEIKTDLAGRERVVVIRTLKTRKTKNTKTLVSMFRCFNV